MNNRHKLMKWILLLLIFECLLFGISFFFAQEILLELLLLLVLGFFAAIVLSDLLLTWLILISSGLGIVLLIVGVVYIPDLQRSLLFISFPVLLEILIKIRYFLFKTVSKIQSQEHQALTDYQSLVTDRESNPDSTIQSLLIHWSHEELFFQINPKEYNQILVNIREVIAQHLKYNDHLYYISDGNFLVFTNGDHVQLCDFYENELKGKLEKIIFNGEDGLQAIQFQTGYLEVNDGSKRKYNQLKHVLSNLKRQLETDIIVEY